MFTSSDVADVLDEYGWHTIAYQDKPFAVIIDGRAVIVKVHGKSRLGDGATEVWIAVEIEGRYFKKSGYHQSHYVTEWDGSLEEVSPQEKTVTVYERI